ncbi:TRAP transporter large permease subunit [Anaerotruncus rubiinfantis]|uniref:TRAP transporter large permease subunit n=3 Tax=Anaerotruncus rubiinfantis TaxID=1720200 RepID=UPI001899410F
MAIIMFGIMILLIFTGAPVFVAMGIGCAVFILTQDTISLVGIANHLFSGANSFTLMAVPFYLLTGELMNSGGITRRIMDLAQSAVGQISGGLAHVNILSSTVMAGMSGSASADAATTSVILIPEMVAKGYPKPFAAAVTACSAVIGPIIPPSINMLIFASVASVSVGKMFVAGFLPGVIICLYEMIVTYFIAKKRRYGIVTKFSWANFFHALKRGILPLLTPVIIMGGILFGWYTPTEAAVAAALYAGLLGFLYGELTWKKLPGVILRTTSLTATTMIIVSASNVMGWVAALDSVPQKILSAFLAVTSSKVVVMAVLILFYLLIGLIMDGVAITLLTVPIVMPLISNYGIDPIYFGVVMVVALMIGQITPPVGMVMYITTSITKVSLGEFMRESVPYLAALSGALVTMALLPGAVVWLPNLIIG